MKSTTLCNLIISCQALPAICSTDRLESILQRKFQRNQFLGGGLVGVIPQCVWAIKTLTVFIYESRFNLLFCINKVAIELYKSYQLVFSFCVFLSTRKKKRYKFIIQCYKFLNSFFFVIFFSKNVIDISVGCFIFFFIFFPLQNSKFYFN